MNISVDTIAAIATAPGEAGISIVRVSGAKSLDIADRIFSCTDPPPSRRPGNAFVRGFIHSTAEAGSNTHVDEVILLIYRSPHSYTREDVVEIQGHGGRSPAQRILSAVLTAGARIAEPGEFTKRAFLNGRIDLLQAEAVADLIRAKSDRAAKAALEQLEGRLSAVIADTYENLLAVAADLEACLDFPDDDLPATVLSNIIDRLSQTIASCEQLLGTWHEGHILREGALVVISGPPNAGKSTLLNRLLARDRAIVSDVPGTTRDTIEEEMVLDGIVLRLVDTAGLRETDSLVEREGVKRAERTIAKADVNIYVIDSSKTLDANHWSRISHLLEGTESFILLNKIDKGQVVTDADIPKIKAISTSLIDGTGIDAVRESILQTLGLHNEGAPRACISERHKACVQKALNALNKGMALLQNGSEDTLILAANCLRDGLHPLALVGGREYSEDLLTEIFNRFCVGK